MGILSLTHGPDVGVPFRPMVTRDTASEIVVGACPAQDHILIPVGPIQQSTTQIENYSAWRGHVLHTSNFFCQKGNMQQYTMQVGPEGDHKGTPRSSWNRLVVIVRGYPCGRPLPFSTLWGSTTKHFCFSKRLL